MFVSEPVTDVSSREEREAAFRGFVSEFSQSVAGLQGRTFESTGDGGQAMDNALRDLRKRAGQRLSGVLTSNAVVTLRVVASMARLGLRLGPDVGLVGFDDTEWSPYVGPGLSTIAQPTDDLGRIAAGCLIERLKGLELPPRQILLSGRLVTRGSSQTAVI